MFGIKDETSLSKGFLSELCPHNRSRKGYLVERWKLNLRNWIQIAALTLFTQKILFPYDGFTTPNNYVTILKCNYASNFIRIHFLEIYFVKMFSLKAYMSKGCLSELFSSGLTRIAQFEKRCSLGLVLKFRCALFFTELEKISTRIITLPIRRYFYIMIMNLNKSKISFK